MFERQDLTQNSDIIESIHVAIPVTPFQVRAGAADTNGASQAGVSRPCLSCLIIAGAANTGVIRVRVGSACTSTTGIIVPKPGTLGVSCSYLPLPVQDVNCLYFIGTVEADTVDILWRN